MKRQAFGLKIGIAVNAMSIIIVAIFMYQHVTPFKETIKIRNALVAQVADRDAFTWIPGEGPSDFLIEQGEVPSRFREIAREVIGDKDNHTNFQKSLLIANHLAGMRRGPGVHSSTVDAYEQMSKHKRGYCADYSQVFNGIAIASNVPVREWHLAWRAFGDGHSFNEIYDDSMSKWIFIDSYYSFYVADEDSGTPLSVLEFQERLRNRAKWDRIRVVPIDHSKFRFRPPDRTIETYAKGADQFFLWWGNNVFSYDNHPLVKIIDPMSRSLAQAGAILLGIQPKMRIVKTETNQAHIDELWRVKSMFYTYVILLMLMAGLFWFQLWVYKQRSKKLF